MNYYIQQDEKIVLFDENLERLQNTIAIMPQYQGLEIQETSREIILLDNEFVFADEHQEELARQEQERINQNARDFLNETDWMVIRHRDQLALGIPTSLTEEEFQQLLLDRQAARDQVIR